MERYTLPNMSPRIGRMMANLSREEAARQLGMSEYAIVACERGKSDITLTNARRMARLYQIPLEVLFPDEDDAEADSGKK